MNDTVVTQLAQRGLVTLPKIWREAYRLHPGDPLTLLDLGGVFIISPGRSQLDALANELAQTLAERGETLESMLLALRDARQSYNEKTEPAE